jgi:hypothetical protein
MAVKNERRRRKHKRRNIWILTTKTNCDRERAEILYCKVIFWNSPYTRQQVHMHKNVHIRYPVSYDICLAII